MKPPAGALEVHGVDGPATVAARPRTPDPLPYPLNYPAYWLEVRRRWRRSRREQAARDAVSPIGLTLRARFTGSGIAVTSEVYRALDVHGRPWGFVHVAETGHGSLVLSLRLPSDTLGDTERARTWLARVGLWMTLLAHEPDLAACVVTIDQAIDQASGHASNPTGQQPVGPDGPDGLAVRVQLTYRVSGPHGRRSPADQATEVAARIPGLLRSLHDLGPAVPATAEEICATITTAYPPTPAITPVTTPATSAARSRGGARRARAVDLALREAWDCVRPAVGTTASRTWSLSQVASSVVLASALPPLTSLAPADVSVRISLLTAPPGGPGSRHDPGEWTGLSQHVLGDRTRDPSDDRHDRHDRDGRHDGADGDLHLAAAPFSMMVTATTRQDRLAAAAHAVRSCLPRDVQPWLRPLYGDQAAGFTAGLPLGLVLAQHVEPPTVLAAAPLTSTPRALTRR